MHTILRAVLAIVLALTSIPAKREGKLFLVPVRISSHGPYWFCLDTGAHHVVIDPFIVKELGLKVTGQTTTKGTGQGEVATERVASLDLSIGDAKLRAEEPLVIDLSGVPIPKFVHGLVGADLLESFVVELDPERSTVRLFDPRTFHKPAGAVEVPLEDTNHRLFMPVTIDVNGKETVVRRARIDTGSEDSVGDAIVKDGRHVRETTLGNGLGTDYKGISGVFDAVHIGLFTIRNVWAPGTPNTAIGMEILRRFTVTFDVAHHVMYLQPNRHMTEPVPAPE
jgi:predicted aspartyl protease